MTKRTDDEDRRQQQLRRLGKQHPICVTCGESDPAALDRHHIAGKKHSRDLALVCASCHRKLSVKQRGHAATRSRETEGPLEKIGHYLMGLADMFAMIAEALRRFGAWLLGNVPRPSLT